MVAAMRVSGVVSSCFLAASLTAQLGGPIGGDPFPKGPSEQNTKGSVKDALRVVTAIRGIFRARDGNEIFVEPEDKRVLIIKITKTTEHWKDYKKVKSIDFQPGDQLVIDATQDEVRKFIALSIVFERHGTEAEKAAARQPLEETMFHRAQNVPGAKQDPPKGKAKDKDKEKEEAPSTPEPPATIQAVKAEEDPDRPKLARGRRTPPAPPEEPVAAIAAPSTPPKPAAQPVVLNTKNEFDPFLDKVREELDKYVSTLPNYIVKQMTTRYTSTTAKTDWRALDHVEADLLVENGQERYLNLDKKKMENGAWSSGEFITLMKNLFTPGVAEFRYRGTSSMQKRPARLYDFKVTQERSSWHIVTPGQRYYPAYKGSVWIDKDVARPLRIEMQALQLPQQFPIDTVESATDYDFVNIGGALFLLPVKSDVLTCTRGSSECSLNTIEFRNYKKFGAKSDITF